MAEEKKKSVHDTLYDIIRSANANSSTIDEALEQITGFEKELDDKTGQIETVHTQVYEGFKKRLAETISNPATDKVTTHEKTIKKSLTETLEEYMTSHNIDVKEVTKGLASEDEKLEALVSLYDVKVPAGENNISMMQIYQSLQLNKNQTVNELYQLLRQHSIQAPEAYKSALRGSINTVFNKFAPHELIKKAKSLIKSQATYEIANIAGFHTNVPRRFASFYTAVKTGNSEALSKYGIQAKPLYEQKNNVIPLKSTYKEAA